MLHLHASQTERAVANGTDAGTADLQHNAQREPHLNADLCIISRIIRTIGAQRGRAARGAPERA
jgi:hypothetical protein